MKRKLFAGAILLFLAAPAGARENESVARARDARASSTRSIDDALAATDASRAAMERGDAWDVVAQRHLARGDAERAEEARWFALASYLEDGSDLAWYDAALEYEALGEREHAAEVYALLLRHTRSKPLAGRAHFALGELATNDADAVREWTAARDALPAGDALLPFVRARLAQRKP